jgi:hypothetical protein
MFYLSYQFKIIKTIRHKLLIFSGYSPSMHDNAEGGALPAHMPDLLNDGKSYNFRVDLAEKLSHQFAWKTFQAMKQ